MEKFIPVAFAIAFPIMWAAVSLVLAHMGGWSKLAQCYADPGNVIGKTYYMRSGFVGPINYKSCLNLRVSESGLGLSVLFPFRIGHPPLFIPWDQFHSVSEKRVFFFRFLDVYVGKPVVANVVLPLWIRDYLPPQDRAL